MLFLSLLFITVITCQQIEFTIQSCGLSSATQKKRKQRIAFITHESAISTFFHNPEQGSRDAANIVDVTVEWNRYMTTKEDEMHENIRKAVDDQVDGIICSIPNEITYEAVKYAVQMKIPVIVFNSGLKYANRLGLTSVLQNNFDAGVMLGENMVKANVTKPLAIKLNTMEDGASNLRLQGITQSMMGIVPGILEISDNSSYAPTKSIVDTYINGGYDSIISLGGSVKCSPSHFYYHLEKLTYLECSFLLDKC